MKASLHCGVLVTKLPEHQTPENEDAEIDKLLAEMDELLNAIYGEKDEK